LATLGEPDVRAERRDIADSRDGQTPAQGGWGTSLVLIAAMLIAMAERFR